MCRWGNLSPSLQIAPPEEGSPSLPFPYPKLSERSIVPNPDHRLGLRPRGSNQTAICVCTCLCSWCRDRTQIPVHDSVLPLSHTLPEFPPPLLPEIFQPGFELACYVAKDDLVSITSATTPTQCWDPTLQQNPIPDSLPILFFCHFS